MIEELAATRGFGFSLERACFLTVLHRLMVSGSDRAADAWREDYRIEGAEERYVVCRNLAEAEKDAADREAIVTPLRRALKAGDKALVGNAGYRRFLKAPEIGFAIDQERVAEDARFDGIFVLRTNTTLDPLQAMLRYRELQGVEQLFRSAKSLLATRPIFHKCDATIRGHVFCSFLALVLQKELADRCAVRGLQTLRPADPGHGLRPRGRRGVIHIERT